MHEKLLKSVEAFQKLTTDFESNINHLTATCGELLGADYALYTRLEGDKLHSIGRWQIPRDYPSRSPAEGHITYHLLNRGPGCGLVVMRNLASTSYSKTDPNVAIHGINTYAGNIVSHREKPLGVLGAFFKEDKNLGEEEKVILETLGAAIGTEESRLLEHRSLSYRNRELSNILESIPDPVIHLDKYGNCQFANAAHKDVLGYNPEYLKGKSIYPLIHPGDLGTVVGHTLEKITGSPPPENGGMQFRFKHACGDYVWLESNTSILYDESGAPAGFLIVSRNISDRKKTERELQQTKSVLESTLNTISDGITIKSPDYRIIRCNRTCSENFNVSPEQVVNKRCYELKGRNEPCAICATTEALETKKFEKVEKYIPESQKYLDCRSTPVLDENNEISMIVEQYRDITALKEAELKIQKERDYFQSIFNSMDHVIVVIDSNCYIQFLNTAAVDLLGNLEGENCYDVLGQVKKCQDCPVEEFIKSGEPGPVQYSINFAGRVFEGTASKLLNSEGENFSTVCLLTDVTEKKQMEEQLKYLSFHDSLTGLYNRAYFEQEMQRLEDGRYSPVGIIICDLDNLKLVNDTMGHEKGDELLIAGATALKECFRGGDVIARIGGDEFAVLLPRSNTEIVEKAVSRIQKTIESHNQQNPEFPLNVSTGYSVSNTRPVNMEALFKEADNNMYRNKQYKRSLRTQNALIEVFKKSLYDKDFLNLGHGERLYNLMLTTAKSMDMPGYCTQKFQLLACYHDIGKVAIDENIIFKKEPLTREEIEKIKQHCEIGHRIAQSTAELSSITECILRHHEWWNGQGYPLGLQGEEIPLECRLLAIADAYDVMTSDRPYRRAMTREEAVAELRKHAGSQFDPHLVEEFIKALS